MVKVVLKVVEIQLQAKSTESKTLASQDQTAALSARPAVKIRIDKREKSCAIITSALGDAPLRVAMESEDDPFLMVKLLSRRSLCIKSDGLMY